MKRNRPTSAPLSPASVYSSLAGEVPPAPLPSPFSSAFEYLESWFGLLGPGWLENESWARLADIPSFDERIGYLRFLAARTEATLAAGKVELPFETFVRNNDLAAIERLVLLALLRAAHDPVGERGLEQIRLLRALGADSLERQSEVLARVEAAGRLRDLRAVHCIPDPSRRGRVYRVAPWLVEPLTTGEGRVEGLPELSHDPIEEFELLSLDVANLREAVRQGPAQFITLWQAPAGNGPGWDHTALRRFRLSARLDAAARSQHSAIGAEIRRLGLEGDERLVWAFLLDDCQTDPLGVTVPLLLRASGLHADSAVAAERLLGSESKLGRDDAIRFNRPAGPLVARLAWISRTAAKRVIPWERDSFKHTRYSEDSRAVGFTASGVEMAALAGPGPEAGRGVL